MGAKEGASKKDPEQHYMIASFFDTEASQAYDFYIRPQDTNLQKSIKTLAQLKLCNVDLRISAYQNKAQVDLIGVEGVK